MADQDYAQTLRDMMGKMDTTAMENAWRAQGAYAERLAAVAIEAAQRSTELTAKWTQDTLSKMQDATRAKAEPADYAKSASEFMTRSAESAAEHMAAFAEIAKRVQSETLEIMLAAGREAGEGARKAGENMAQSMNGQHNG